MRKKLAFITWKTFRKATEGKTTDEEQQIFDKWLEANEENKSYFIKAMRYFQDLKNDKQRPIKSPSEAFEQFLVASAAPAHKNHRYLHVAATLLILVTAGWFLQLSLKQKDYNTLSQSTPISASQGQIELILSSGQSVLLDKSNSSTIKDKSGAIVQSQGSVDYLSFTSKNPNKEHFNTVKVPRGTDFKVILADSTVVYLNAESSITYPTHFADNIRKVSITGEAYFDVKEDKSKPFIVNMNESSIKVLGTEFNVNTFDEELGIITTLIEGSVMLKNAYNQTAVIKPNEQAIMGQQIDIDIKTVDTRQVVDWRQGQFIFEDEPLKNILADLSRWYNLDIFYEQQELKNLQFTGTLDRNNSVNELLELLELTQSLKFYIKDNALLVKKAE